MKKKKKNAREETEEKVMGLWMLIWNLWSLIKSSGSQPGGILSPTPSLGTFGLIWWYFWCLVKIDVFQLYGAIIYNKLYIAVFKEEIMMNWDHSLPERQISPFYTFPHLAWRGSCIYHLGLSHLTILSSRSFSSAAWWKVFSKHLFFFFNVTLYEWISL